MSQSINNLIQNLNQTSAWLQNQLLPYDDHLTAILNFRNSIGAEDLDATNLTEIQTKHYKCGLILIQSCDLPLTGSLRLLYSGVVSEAAGVARVLIEVYSIFRYCNTNPEQHWEEFYQSFFGALEGREQSKSEWKFIQKAMKALKDDDDEMRELSEYFNNYGAHISRDKLLSNIKTVNGQTAPGLLKPNEFTRELGIGLDALAVLTLRLTDEYLKLLVHLGVENESSLDTIKKMKHSFYKEVRPHVQSLLARYKS